MPTRFFVPLDSWVGRHQSYKQKIEGYYDFDAYGPGAGLKECKKVSKGGS